MKIRKWIAYCYPSSSNADTLGQAGYYVEQSVLREDNTWSPGYIEQGHDVFDSVADPDLLQLLIESDGDYYSPFCKYYDNTGWLVTKEQQRLESIRQSLIAENISYGELAELEDLKEHIHESDIELLAAAGVPE